MKQVHMDRAIFDLQATVEATSLYILLCALLDQGEVITLNRAGVQWNGSKESLLRAAKELMEHSVLEKMQSIEENARLRIRPKDKWH